MKRTGSDVTFSQNCVGKKKEKKIIYNFIKEKKNEFAGSFGFIRIQLTREQQLAGIRDGGSGKGLTAVHGGGWCPKGVFRNRGKMEENRYSLVAGKSRVERVERGRRGA